jgi:Polysaccharide deacetylase
MDADRLPPAGDWRQGAAAVAVLSLDVDAEAPILAEGDHYAEDFSTMSHQAYGPRVGVPRILKLLAAREIEATFFVPGVTAERWPGTVEEVLQSGHEVALHGHSHRVLPGMSESEQRRDLEMGLEALGNLGAEPRGYRVPYWRMTRATLDLLARHGIRYDSFSMDDDKPYIPTGYRLGNNRCAAGALVARRLGAVRLFARSGHRSADREPAQNRRARLSRARRFCAQLNPCAS